MKTLAKYFAGMVSVFLLGAPAFASSLVAPAYPHAVNTQITPYAVIYLTNDSPAAVRAFYADRHLKLAAGSSGSSGQSFTGVVLDNRGVCLAEEKAGSHAPVEMSNAPKDVTDFPPNSAGVTVIRNKVPPVESAPNQIAFDKTSVFSGLQREIAFKRHSGSELVNVYNKYRWLESAFYPPHKTAKGSESYYTWLVATTWARINSPQKSAAASGRQMGQSAAAVAARMQKLIAEGRMQEAQQLGQQMAATVQKGQRAAKADQTLQQRDHWQEWMAVIRQLAAHAYKTKIVINTKPANWPMHNVCGG